MEISLLVFLLEKKVNERWNEIIGLKVIRDDGSLTDLGTLSPLSLQINNDYMSNSLFQVFCARANMVKVRKATTKIIKELNKNKAISEFIENL